MPGSFYLIAGAAGGATAVSVGPLEPHDTARFDLSTVTAVTTRALCAEKSPPADKPPLKPPLTAGRGDPHAPLAPLSNAGVDAKPRPDLSAQPSALQHWCERMGPTTHLGPKPLVSQRSGTKYDVDADIGPRGHDAKHPYDQRNSPVGVPGVLQSRLSGPHVEGMFERDSSLNSDSLRFALGADSALSAELFSRASAATSDSTKSHVLKILSQVPQHLLNFEAIAAFVGGQGLLPGLGGSETGRDAVSPSDLQQPVPSRYYADTDLPQQLASSASDRSHHRTYHAPAYLPDALGVPSSGRDNNRVMSTLPSSTAPALSSITRPADSISGRPLQSRNSQPPAVDSDTHTQMAIHIALLADGTYPGRWSLSVASHDGATPESRAVFRIARYLLINGITPDHVHRMLNILRFKVSKEHTLAAVPTYNKQQDDSKPDAPEGEAKPSARTSASGAGGADPPPPPTHSGRRSSHDPARSSDGHSTSHLTRIVQQALSALGQRAPGLSTSTLARALSSDPSMCASAAQLAKAAAGQSGDPEQQSLKRTASDIEEEGERPTSRKMQAVTGTVRPGSWQNNTSVETTFSQGGSLPGLGLGSSMFQRPGGSLEAVYSAAGSDQPSDFATPSHLALLTQRGSDPNASVLGLAQQDLERLGASRGAASGYSGYDGASRGHQARDYSGDIPYSQPSMPGLESIIRAQMEGMKAASQLDGAAIESHLGDFLNGGAKRSAQGVNSAGRFPGGSEIQGQDKFALAQMLAKVLATRQPGSSGMHGASSARGEQSIGKFEADSEAPLKQDAYGYSSGNEHGSQDGRLRSSS